MADVKLPNVSHYHDRHGHRRWRFRRKGHKDVPLPGVPGSPEFTAALARAQAQTQGETIGAHRTAPGSLSALIVAYYESAEWKLLKASTQRMRRNILEAFRAAHGDDATRPYGDRPVSELRREFLLRIRDRRADRPHAANNLLKVLRQLFAFAVDRAMMTGNPAATIKPLRVDSDGFHTWTAGEIERFKAHHASGTVARRAFELFNNTSQRRGDVTRIGRQHDRGDVLVIVQDKTGTALQIPVTPELRRELEAVPRTQLTFLETAKGRPYSAAYLGNEFARWCREAGLPDHCRAHGIRKSVATRLADAGHSAHEIMAVTGHKSLSEVQRYTKMADQKRNAMRTIGALSGTGKEPAVGDPAPAVGDPAATPAENREKNVG